MSQIEQKTTQFQECGINEECIENLDKIPGTVIESLSCIICYGIVKNPCQCNVCQSLYCEECYNQLKIKGQNCVVRCENSKIKKADPFIYNVLEKLKMKCPTCGVGGMTYSMFVVHVDICEIYKKYSDLNELQKISVEKDEEIAGYEKKKKDMENGVLVVDDIDSVPQNLVRMELITNKLTSFEKLDLYKAASEGNLEEFKKLIEQKKFPLLEEVSAGSFYWTPLHYAMHYGKMNVAFYIMDKLKEQDKFDKAMLLESNDGRNPLLCLLKSNALKGEDKRNYFALLTNKYKIFVNTATAKEIKNRNLEKIYKENQSKFAKK